MRFLVALLILVALNPKPVLADQKEEKAAKKWRERHENKTLRQSVSRKIFVCMDNEILGSVPISPDERLGDIPGEMVTELYHIYLECRNQVQKSEKKLRRKRGRKQISPPQDAVLDRLTLIPENVCQISGGVFLWTHRLQKD